jgi:hypothetical protein
MARSSVIQRALYDDATASLTIALVTGRTYVYEDVPRATYDAFMAAKSQGQFYNTHIRDEFYVRELT